MMRSPTFWVFIYTFMGCSFVYFAIHQKSRAGSWDVFTILLMMLAAYDFMMAFKYARAIPPKEDKK